MKKPHHIKLITFCAVRFILGVASPVAAADTAALSLAGAWEIRMDKTGGGIEEKWFQQTFAGDPAILPGTVDTNPRQPPAVTGGAVDFDAVYPYTGGVWYQRTVEIPQDWNGKQISLFLERCQWETVVWVDDAYLGTSNSLVAPHIYGLPKDLKPGPRRLTILVDNANRKGQAEIKSQDVMKHKDLSQDIIAGAKLNCGGHHTLFGYNWNGIVGKMELRAAEPQNLISLDVYPDLAAGAVKIKALVANRDGAKESTRLQVSCRPLREPVASRTVSQQFSWPLTGEAEQTFNDVLSLKLPVDLWDEFTPNLYLLTAELRDPQGRLLDTREVRFGMRELGRKDHSFTINGRPTFMRGVLECFIFPLTGHPPVDVESWRKLIGVTKSYGLNLMRFHTCTPPEAAFQAADELGFYLQVELPGTSCPTTPESPEVEAYLFDELKRLVRTYGNHPSMLFVSMGNEQLITPPEWPSFINHQAALKRKVDWGQKEDARHFYTCTTHPWTAGRTDDFYVTAWGPNRMLLNGFGWGGGELRATSWLNKDAPNTTHENSEAIKGIDRPVMSHEVGQWQVYPDLREITRYHGAKRAFNFEKIREDLLKKGRLEFANDYTRASGKLSLELYREEIEAQLRTPNMGGFQLLDLHDYPGQGTSTVGILNSLWESKGLITPGQFRAFCGPVVALARLPKRVWTNADSFRGSLEIRNSGPVDLPDLTTSWRLEDSHRHIHAQGEFQHSAPQGSLAAIGEIAADLKSVGEATKMRLHVETVGVTTNAWDLWVYPDALKSPVPEGITLTHTLDESAMAALKAGGTVLFSPAAGQIENAVPGTFTTAFWNVRMKGGDQISKTMGILCDPAHPALATFPTEFHSNWQWWDVVMRSSAVAIDSLPAAMRPIVQVVDNPYDNRLLAKIFEARVGDGRLLFCGADIANDLEARPVARQLRKSLLSYMAGPQFRPDVVITTGDLGRIIHKNPMKEPGVKATADSEAAGHEAAKAIDGNPETLWHTPWGEGVTTAFPHSLTVELVKELLLTGCSILPRQGYDAGGMIRSFEIHASADGKDWGEPLVKGEFQNTRELQRVAFSKPVKAKFLRLVALSGFDGNPFASVAEFDVEL